MENLQSKTPYNFKKSYGGTPEPLPPEYPPAGADPLLKKVKRANWFASTVDLRKAGTDTVPMGRKIYLKTIIFVFEYSCGHQASFESYYCVSTYSQKIIKLSALFKTK